VLPAVLKDLESLEVRANQQVLAALRAPVNLSTNKRQIGTEIVYCYCAIITRRAEMRMVRWMCGVKLKDRLPSKELRERLGVDDIAIGIAAKKAALLWACAAKR